MTQSDLQQRVREAAGRLGCLIATNPDERAILSFAIGAAYSLDKALAIGFADRTGKALPLDFSIDLHQVSLAISESRDPAPQVWVAGFYFNSALLRLAAVAERVTIYKTGSRQDLLPAVRREVNSMKHRVDAFLRTGRTVSSADAVRALLTVVDVLESLLQTSPASRGRESL